MADSSVPQEIGDRTFRFAARIVRYCISLDERPGVNWTLSRQLLRSGTSIGANVEEGKGSQSRADFCAKYSIALKEARETHYWLRLIRETHIANCGETDALVQESDELVRILT